VQLNPAQREAVEARDADILCLACAGAGKTRVLIERIAHLIETDTPPWAIIGITFTNKAADEMRERLAGRVGKRDAAQVWMGTFHAFAAMVMRQFGHLVGFHDGFSIYDDDDRLDVFKLCAHEMGLKLTAKDPTIEGIVGKAGKRAPMLRSLYEAKLRQYGATDYDGLETHLLALLQLPQVREHMQRYREVMVDEFQDTNDVQESILATLRDAVPHLRIFRTGDYSQGVYSFRSANPQNIIDASNRSGMRVIRLATNYRSGRAIVEAGNRIAADTGSPLGRVDAGPAADEGSVVGWHHDTDKARAAEIAKVIAGAIADVPRHPSDIMVLARTWKALAAVEAELVALGIPCEYPKREADGWKTDAMWWLVAAMRLHRNPRDGIALRRVLRWPTDAASEAQVVRAEARGGVLAELRKDGIGLARLAFAGTPQYEDVPGESAHGFARAFAIESGAGAECTRMGFSVHEEQLNDAVARIGAWCQRRQSEGKPDDIKAFLSWYAFRDVRDAEAPTVEGGGKVRLLTIHAAKGLESPVVHFVGPDLGIFPRKGEDPKGEELRLWYVAVTRARDVFVAHTADDVEGWSGPMRAGPSPFVEYLTES